MPKVIWSGSPRPAHPEGRMKSDVGDLLDQLGVKKPQLTLAVGGYELSVTNLEKTLWPGSGRVRPLTKRDYLQYPLFVTRYPNGVTGKSFYQKHWDNPPAFVRTVSIYSSHTEGDGDYLICENLPTLLWLGQMAGLELHRWFSRVDPAPDARGRGRRFSGSEVTLEAEGDPWAGILAAKQDLGELLEAATAG
jgi:bifunctional non-homologous end joining protein LigD